MREGLGRNYTNCWGKKITGEISICKKYVELKFKNPKQIKTLK